jgi:hypothetical protein
MSDCFLAGQRSFPVATSPPDVRTAKAIFTARMRKTDGQLPGLLGSIVRGL